MEWMNAILCLGYNNLVLITYSFQFLNGKKVALFTCAKIKTLFKIHISSTRTMPVL